VQSTHFSLTSYLQRIHFVGQPEATIEGITSLMRHQLFAVPFENLDVQAGKLISLVPEHIVDKIVHQGRGGYCYEINGLFCMALEALGVAYHWVAARPMFYPVRRPKTHMAIIVQLGGRQWLVDLGFGSYGITAPMALDALGQEVKQGHDTFKLTCSGSGDYLLQALVEGAWVNQYGFDLTAQEWVDFEPANHLNSTHPEAVFVKSLLVIGHNARGRTILFGSSLKTVVDGVVSKRIVEPHEIDALLKDTFELIRPA
jgi:N-hydroxyarylamine O-acetyltransferase